MHGCSDEPDSAASPYAFLCVLASGSAGNCSVLHMPADDPAASRTAIIDAGISIRRVRRALEDLGLTLDTITDVLLTHFDSDHANPALIRRLAETAAVRCHRAHASEARHVAGAEARVELFDSPFALGAVGVAPELLRHDAAGVSAFRFAAPRWSLGFATDVGRLSPELLTLMHEVDVLAIESNYCPDMQLASGRPERLKRRIMGGSGHLSNHQAIEAIARVRPRRDVVLLHLSRQCNRPDLVADLHRDVPYRLTITSQSRPTGRIRLGPVARRGETPAPVVRFAPSLFDAVAAGPAA